MRWVEPAVFLEHDGVKVYHTYRHDNEEDRSEFIFTTDPTNSDRDSGCEYHFDVRDLRIVEQGSDNWKTLRIQIGLNQGLIDVPEEVIVNVMAERLEDSDLLLELVHDVASRCASNVNNAGPVEQLRYLAENIGFKEMKEEVTEILDRSKGVK
mgnify:FL=1